MYTKDGKVAACFEFRCANNNIQVLFDDKSYECDENNEVSDINGYEGKIYCPSKETLCHSKFKCKFGCTEKYENKNGFFNYNFK